MRKLLNRQLYLVKKHGFIERLCALIRRFIGLSLSTVYAWCNVEKSRLCYLSANEVSREYGLPIWLCRLCCDYAVGALSLDKITEPDYRIWLDLYETPSVEVIQKFRHDACYVKPILIILSVDQNSIDYFESTIDALLATIGQPWYAIVVVGNDCDKILLKDKLISLIPHEQRLLDSYCPSIEFDITILLKVGISIKPHACRIMSEALRVKHNAMVAYSDEDRIMADGSHSNPWFKPEYTPLLAAQGWLLGGLIGVKNEFASSRSLVNRLSHGKSSFQAFVAGLVEPLSRDEVVSIPHVLYGDYVPALTPIPLIINSQAASIPKVSVIIPTRDRWDLLGPCLTSLLMTDWPLELMEIVVVDNGTTDPEALEMLAREEADGRLKCVRDPEAFNWSRLNNVGTAHSSGEVLVFLNNDTEVLDPQWLKKMVPLTMMTRVGAVGCKLVYPDGTVQHGGVIAGIHGRPVHAHIGLDAMSNGYYQLATMTHEVSAVTGACLLVTRQKFYSLGGFNEKFRVAFNDIDFCFRLLKMGLYNVCVGVALLIHKECKSRGYDTTPEKLQLQHEEAARTWQLHYSIMRNDPFYSPNLSAWKPYELSFLPRRRPLWDSYSNSPRKVLILAQCHHNSEFVAQVIIAQSGYLQAAGYHVAIAGPRSFRDQTYKGCERYMVHDDVRAALLAAELGVDLVIAHSQPFYAIARWTGVYPAVMACIYDTHGSKSESSRVILNSCDVAEQELYVAMATAKLFINSECGKSSKSRTKSSSSKNKKTWMNEFMEIMDGFT